ncbi:MAG: TIGR02530 family flagellar biosynthesis protein [Bacillota bacterium]|jgi:flagellar operon protein
MRIDNRLLQYGEIIQKGAKQNTQIPSAANVQSSSFKDILHNSLHTHELIFSKHAEQRLQQRSITLSPLELQKLNQATYRAGEKGINNTLILMENRAFIVNVPSSTVITAMDGNDMKENVFTQIDGAVIA